MGDLCTLAFGLAEFMYILQQLKYTTEVTVLSYRC